MIVDLVRKFKWYIIGFILVAIMLSVSLSFCAWDSLSAKVFMNAKGGMYYEKIPYVLAQDNGVKGRIDVGDTVYYGQYYQSVAGDTLSPLEWRVVDINAYGNYVLMTENVIANGCFYGDKFYHTDYIDVLGMPYSQEYNSSTTRAWLNNTARYDGGTNFNTNNVALRNVFNGFYETAFETMDKSVLVPRVISGMTGYGVISESGKTYTKSQYSALNSEKVWIPSAWELGFDILFNKAIDDNKNDRQFEYFVKGGSRAAYSTAFTTSTLSNFTHINATFLGNNTDLNSKITEGQIVKKCYALRSPSPVVNIESIMINGDGILDDRASSRSYLGVRPCVIVRSEKNI